MLHPDLQSLTPEQILQARQSSPAIHRYLELIERTPENFSDELRLLRHNSWLTTALKTFFHRDSTEKLCKDWSLATDDVLKKAWQYTGCKDLDLCLLAMGKYGAYELNLSSDVDLIFVTSGPVQEKHTQAIKSFIRNLSEVTEWGFCYRVDTDLRPHGRLGSILCSLDQYQNYYWTQGATWERLAQIRMRPIAGPEESLRLLEETRSGFAFRKFIDYSLLDDLRGLRGRIHRETYEPDSIHLKLGVGGIRDIELFIQALQVIHGGKLQSLQTRSTPEACQKLAEKELHDKQTLSFLLETYWELRHLEHLQQLVNDQQTHKLSDVPDELVEKMKRVDEAVSSLIGESTDTAPTLPSTPEMQKAWLTTLGFNANNTGETWDRLVELTALSTRSTQDEIERKTFLYCFIEELSRSGGDKDLGFELLYDFVKNTRAKASFFSLLNRERPLLEDLAVLFSRSPYLGGIIASRPELIDSFVYRVQEEYSLSDELLFEQLTERRLLTEIIAASRFLKNQRVSELSPALSLQADEICRLLLARLNSDQQSSDLDILCLGKWSGQELGVKSDLDFIFVTKNSPTEANQKVARRFISRLTEQHRGGSLYSVDLRLRPSGRAGPLIVSEQSLLEHIKAKAPAWQRQSYLRSRFLSSPGPDIAQVAAERGLSSDELSELGEIRSKLKTENLRGKVNIKYSSGGLVDLEFAAQTRLLLSRWSPPSAGTIEMFNHLAKQSDLWNQHLSSLTNSYEQLRCLEQLLHIAGGHSFSELDPRSEAVRRVARWRQISPEELIEEFSALLKASAERLKELDPIFSPS